MKIVGYFVQAFKKRDHTGAKMCMHFLKILFINLYLRDHSVGIHLIFERIEILSL